MSVDQTTGALSAADSQYVSGGFYYIINSPGLRSDANGRPQAGVHFNTIGPFANRRRIRFGRAVRSGANADRDAPSGAPAEMGDSMRHREQPGQGVPFKREQAAAPAGVVRPAPAGAAAAVCDTAADDAGSDAGQPELRPIRYQNVVYSGMAVKLNQCPKDGRPEIVLAGRSNAGKSSLVNGLCGRSAIARVSSTPGKTQAVQYFLVDERFYLTDLPGYGYARTSRENQARFAALTDRYMTAGRPIAGVLHLMDIRHQPSAGDRLMHEWLEGNGIPYVIVLAKADKLSRAQQQRRKREVTEALDLAAQVPVVAISNLKKTGYTDLHGPIAAILDRFNAG